MDPWVFSRAPKILTVGYVVHQSIGLSTYPGPPKLSHKKDGISIMAEVEYSRLHVTPFNAALRNTIIPASMLPDARNISYHTIQTFPERGYGYVELPTLDADRVKKRLNGSILKGTKVKIEKARPRKIMLPTEEEPERPKMKEEKKKKKRKRDELPGVEIGDRHVKRGWTTPGKDVRKGREKEKMVIKSKYTTGPECLFKTVLPPNVASKEGPSVKMLEKREKKRQRKAGKEATVHEFAKTTKYATFLKGSLASQTTRAVAAYIEGKGWVDGAGNLVEEEKKSKRRKQQNMEPEPEPEPDLQPRPIGEIESSSLSEEVEEDMNSTEEKPDDLDGKHTIEAFKRQRRRSGKSDSCSSKEFEAVDISNATAQTREAESSSDSSAEDSPSIASLEWGSALVSPQSQPAPHPPSSTGPALSIKIPSPAIIAAVHPLEALYKRPTLDLSRKVETITPSFSFFGADKDDVTHTDADDSQSQMPLTPFTKRDFEFRGIRSAAPTPDTAHPNKRFMWPVDDTFDEEGIEVEASSPVREKVEAAKGEEKKETEESKSEFQNWFWDNRGNLSRAWKRRRKTVAKEKRQQENRKGREHGL